MDWCFRWSKGWIRKGKTTGVAPGGGLGGENILDFKAKRHDKQSKAWDVWQCSTWGEYYRTPKVDPNSQIAVIAIIHTITWSWENKLPNNVIYITGQFYFKVAQQNLGMMYCPCIFLQNRSKCAHVCACARETFTHVLDQFTFLPTFFSHLHGVRVTPERGRKPCGRIRKWSIFWEHSGIEAEQHMLGFEWSIDE